jgi:hypothetical protein
VRGRRSYSADHVWQFALARLRVRQRILRRAAGSGRGVRYEREADDEARSQTRRHYQEGSFVSQLQSVSGFNLNEQLSLLDNKSQMVSSPLVQAALARAHNWHFVDGHLCGRWRRHRRNSPFAS